MVTWAVSDILDLTEPVVLISRNDYDDDYNDDRSSAVVGPSLKTSNVIFLPLSWMCLKSILFDRVLFFQVGVLLEWQYINLQLKITMLMNYDDVSVVCVQVRRPPEMLFSLRPQQSNTMTEAHARIDLYIKCPLAYPNM